MPLTLDATTITNPDQGGTSAVTDATTTGHAATGTAASAEDLGPGGSDSETLQRSVRWSDFPAAPAGVTSLALVFSWTATGSASVDQDVSGSGSASIEVTIEYSIDNGGSWTPVVSETASVSVVNTSDSLNEGDSEEIVLNVAQDCTLVQLRALYEASASATAPSGGSVTSSASLATQITAIGLRVETSSSAGPTMVALW